MKTLQNNFTTTEQSKRLLELGVPADSADCYYLAIGHEPKKYGYSDFPYFITTNIADLAYLTNPNIPCWSVGRLMEIFDICCILKDGTEWMDTQSVPVSYVAYIIDCYVHAIKHKQLDFSKLED